MDIFAAFATDEKKEIEGAWFDLPGGDGARVLVARSNNPRYSKALVKAFEKYSKAPKGSIDEKKQEDEYISLLAEHILLGWEDIQFKGKPFAYSKENAATALRMKEFRLRVQEFSDTFEAYKAEIEEDVGNA